MMSNGIKYKIRITIVSGNKRNNKIRIQDDDNDLKKSTGKQHNHCNV
jgi:hypothetical protein